MTGPVPLGLRSYRLCVLVKLVADVKELRVSRQVPEVDLDVAAVRLHGLDAVVDTDRRYVPGHELV